MKKQKTGQSGSTWTTGRTFLLLYTIFLTNIALSLPVYADKAFPIYYWQLTDQEKHIHPSNMEQLNWREIRRRFDVYRSARQELKILTLETLAPESNIHIPPPLQGKTPDAAVTVIRDPNGKIHLLPETNIPDHVELPDDDDMDLIGRYLLGIHVSLGAYDIDGDGIPENISLDAKHLIPHYKNGGNVGSASVVFFDDPEHLPLEIGPVIDTAKSRYGGNIQRIHRSYEMMVKYMGQPLANAEVTAIAVGSKWKKRFVTDRKGIFEVIPPDDRQIQKDWQNFVYIAGHHDPRNNTYHIATLPITVNKNQPEWHSKAMGFFFWSVAGTGISLLIVMAFIRRKDHQDSRVLVVFENRKIKRDL